MVISMLKNGAFRAFALFGLVLALVLVSAPAPSQAAQGPNPSISLGKLSLVARDVSSDAGIAGAQVIVTGNAGFIAGGLTGKDGAFGISLAPGLYTVNVKATGYLLHSEGVKITSGETTRVDARMTPVLLPGAIVLRALDLSNNTPVAGAVVEMWAASSSEMYRGKTDMAGWLTMELMPNRYYFRVTSPIFETYNGDFTITSSQKTFVTTHLVPVVREGVVIFSVTDAESAIGIPMAVITLRNFDKQVIAKGVTDTDGNLKLTVPTGKYYVEVTVDKYWQVESTIEVGDLTPAYMKVPMKKL